MTGSGLIDATVLRAAGLGKRYHSAVKSGTQTIYDRIGESVNARRGQPVRATEQRWALRDVSFELKRGQILGVIGRNGSGKTTLLKLLAGITAPTEGSVVIQGRVMPLLAVGAGFHPQLTGRDNIALSGAILGMSDAEIVERYDDIVAFSEMGPYLDQPVKHYSSGMYVRLAFSVAAYMPADIMLIDEVLSAGDAEFSAKSHARMLEVLESGRSVVYVGHNMSIIRKLCQDAIVLDAGHVVYRGPASDAVDHYEREMVHLPSATREERGH